MVWKVVYTLTGKYFLCICYQCPERKCSELFEHIRVLYKFKNILYTFEGNYIYIYMYIYTYCFHCRWSLTQGCTQLHVECDILVLNLGTVVDGIYVLNGKTPCYYARIHIYKHLYMHSAISASRCMENTTDQVCSPKNFLLSVYMHVFMYICTYVCICIIMTCPVVETEKRPKD